MHNKTQAFRSNSPVFPTLAGFSAALGSSFTVPDRADLALVLSEAVPLDASGQDERRFSLMFRGPIQAPLEQAIHALAHPVLGELAIFLVPVGRDAGSMHYQAIFN